MPSETGLPNWMVHIIQELNQNIQRAKLSRKWGNLHAKSVSKSLLFALFFSYHLNLRHIYNCPNLQSHKYGSCFYSILKSRESKITARTRLDHCIHSWPGTKSFLIQRSSIRSGIAKHWLMALICLILGITNLKTSFCSLLFCGQGASECVAWMCTIWIMSNWSLFKMFWCHRAL